MPLTPEELPRRFTYHPLQGDRAARYEHVCSVFRRMVELLDALAPDSREKSVAFTHLETAQFWLNAAIAREGEGES